MEKCCNNCKWIQGTSGCEYFGRKNHTIIMFDNIWKLDKDYCSKWEQKEESEVEKLKTKLKEYCPCLGTSCNEESAKYILKNYVSKEKLLKVLDDRGQIDINWRINIKEIRQFIEKQTK